MTNGKGITLIEMVVTFIIISVIALIAVPNYFTYIQQGEAKAAQNNLVTLYTAEKNYYFNNSGYCTSTSNASSSCNTLLNDTHCADNLAALNCNLNLNITDTNFTYLCSSSSGFTCTATNASAGTFVLTLTQNNPLVLPGGASCSPPGTTSGCNPVCSYPAHSNYCPSTSN